MNDRIEIHDSCNMSQAIEKVTGLASDSASPSDTWIVDFKKDTVLVVDSIKDKKKLEFVVKQAFMKVFFSGKETGRYHNPETNKALEYECKVYRYVTNPLKFNKICPHFITNYSYKVDCPYSEFLNLFKDIGLEDELKRNLGMIFFKLNNRPSVNNNIRIKEVDEMISRHDFQKIDVSYMMNEVVSKDTLSLYKWLVKSYSGDLNKRQVVDLFAMMFQIVYACYCLNLFKTAHNDLHIGNVWVTPLPAGKHKNVFYNIEGKEYNFKDVSYWCELFDFDRAYCKFLGKNDLLSGYLCDAVSQCNSVDNTKDVVKFICNIYHSIKNKDAISLVIKDHKDFWEKMFARGCHLNDVNKKGYKKSIKRTLFTKDTYTYPEILDNIYAEYKKAVLDLGSNVCNDTIENYRVNKKEIDSLIKIVKKEIK